MAVLNIHSLIIMRLTFNATFVSNTCIKSEGVRSATNAIQRVDERAQAALAQVEAAHKAIDTLEV